MDQRIDQQIDWQLIGQTDRHRAPAAVRGPCMFCGAAEAAQAPVWPSWVDTLFSERDLAGEAPGPASGGSVRAPMACTACSKGWIESLGSRTRAFLEPALNGSRVALSPSQAGDLAGCMCLVAMNTTLLTTHSEICAGDRAHLRRTSQPPKNWSVFYAGLSGANRSRSCLQHSYRVEFAGNPLATRTKDAPAKPCNTQLVSAAVGPLFFHIFSTPSLLLLGEFAVHARKRGLAQLWPVPRRFGLLPASHLPVPPELMLSDEDATRLTRSFADCLQGRLRQVTATAA